MLTSSPHGVPCARCSQTAASARAPVPGGTKASNFFCDHCLQHRLVQAQVGHDLLELPVLFLELAQSSQLRRSNAAVLLLPDIKRRLADAHLAAHLVDAGSQLVLLQGKGDLVLGELAL